eukprot:TRINITY_DN4627_c0_g2_i1.p1 TRINITY_DN4627_c0_g2~~TRINITY_DN4627_c0_g2_i1.p1  ORF type:complete len:768 (+),score=169.90 TRINITY_DN4627_c0_g2_i1:134-2305(+)
MSSMWWAMGAVLAVGAVVFLLLLVFWLNRLRLARREQWLAAAARTNAAAEDAPALPTSPSGRQDMMQEVWGAEEMDERCEGGAARPASVSSQSLSRHSPPARRRWWFFWTRRGDAPPRNQPSASRFAPASPSSLRVISGNQMGCQSRPLVTSVSSQALCSPIHFPQDRQSLIGSPRAPPDFELCCCSQDIRSIVRHNKCNDPKACLCTCPRCSPQYEAPHDLQVQLSPSSRFRAARRISGVSADTGTSASPALSSPEGFEGCGSRSSSPAKFQGTRVRRLRHANMGSSLSAGCLAASAAHSASNAQSSGAPPPSTAFPAPRPRKASHPLPASAASRRQSCEEAAVGIDDPAQQQGGRVFPGGAEVPPPLQNGGDCTPSPGSSPLITSVTRPHSSAFEDDDPNGTPAATGRPTRALSSATIGSGCSGRAAREHVRATLPSLVKSPQGRAQDPSQRRHMASPLGSERGSPLRKGRRGGGLGRSPPQHGLNVDVDLFLHPMATSPRKGLPHRSSASQLSSSWRAVCTPTDDLEDAALFYKPPEALVLRSPGGSPKHLDAHDHHSSSVPPSVHGSFASDGGGAGGCAGPFRLPKRARNMPGLTIDIADGPLRRRSAVAKHLGTCLSPEVVNSFSSQTSKELGSPMSTTSTGRGNRERVKRSLASLVPPKATERDDAPYVRATDGTLVRVTSGRHLRRAASGTVKHSTDPTELAPSELASTAAPQCCE